MSGNKVKGQRSKVKVALFFYLFALVVATVSLCAEEEVGYDAGNRRNPFIPLVTDDGRFINLDRKDTQDELVLEGIIYDEAGASYAIINGEIVNKLELVGQYQVLNIEKNKVILLKGEEVIEKSLN